MLEYLAKERVAVLDAMDKGLASSMDGLPFGPLAIDMGQRLLDYSKRGKTIRGCLVRLGFELCGGDTSDLVLAKACADAGAAMELFQSGLLIHDDIMDRDDTRRGSPTIHAAYKIALADFGASESDHNGQSLAICMGDIAYFVAFSMLTRLTAPMDRVQNVLRLAADELSLVCVAQARDVANGCGTGLFGQPGEPSEADILSLYRKKTGRYTFSLPLAMGANLAGSSAQARRALEDAGELLGVAFQLKDDELGILADQVALGKPLGSDLREDKKTLIRQRLLAHPATNSTVKAIFGKPDAAKSELDMVRAEAQRLGIMDDIRYIMAQYSQNALACASLVLKAAPGASADVFWQLAQYNLARTK